MQAVKLCVDSIVHLFFHQRITHSRVLIPEYMGAMIYGCLLTYYEE